MSVPAGRPTVEQVARWIRARTKDDNGNEIGTFDDTTRPTDVQVEEQIDVSATLIGTRLPSLDKLSAETLEAVAAVVSLDAACAIEKGYWPEQVQDNRSAYEFLKTERDEELAALEEAANEDAAGGGDSADVGFVDSKVRSWTSITSSCVPPEAPVA